MPGLIRMAVLGLAIGASARAAFAQSTKDASSPPQRIQTAVTYSYMRANAAPGQCGCFNLSGGSADIAIYAWRGLSAVADVTGEHAGNSNIPGQTLSLLFVTAGPRYAYSPRRAPRFVPFVQGLAGVVHGFDAPFPDSSGSTTSSANALAAFLGGGLDISLSRHFAVRPFELEYALSHLPNNVNAHQNLFRYSAGIVFRGRP